MTTEEAIERFDRMAINGVWVEDDYTDQAWEHIKAALAASDAARERAESNLRTLLKLIADDREAHSREGIRWEEMLDEQAAVFAFAATLDAPATGEVGSTPPSA
jgi:hypothetical protein